MSKRGIRNNNPMNIRRGSQWIGLRQVQTDESFCQFVSMTWGLRAGLYLLRKYVVRYGLTSVEEIISRWAPESDGNHTKHYIRRVKSAIRFVNSADEYHFSKKDFVLVGNSVPPELLVMVQTMCMIESDYLPTCGEVRAALRFL